MTDLSNLPDETLRRKADQHDEMASMAAQDGDRNDMSRQYALAKMYKDEIRRRYA